MDEKGIIAQLGSELLPLAFIFGQWASLCLLTEEEEEIKYTMKASPTELCLWHSMKKRFLLTGVAYLNVKPNMWHWEAGTYFKKIQKHFYIRILYC